MEPIELAEYGSREIAASSVALDELAEVAGERLTLTRAAGGKVEIKAGAHVGVIATDEIRVRIRPKVDLDNLFYMLGVGDEAWRVDQRLAPYEIAQDDLVTAVVRLFCREVDTLTSRGLLHGYVAHEESLLAIRGRVAVAATMSRPWQRTRVPCRFDEFIPDIWLNQVLLAALSMVPRVPDLPPALRGNVHLLAQHFEGVSWLAVDIDEVERWKPKRNETHYAVAMTLAAVILRHLSLADRSGGAQAGSFTINMNKLFEDFIGRSIRARLPLGLELSEQHPGHLDRGRKLSLQPDLVLHPSGVPDEPTYVADVKYKLTESLGDISDHYQLLAYATVFDLGEGALIYCQRPDGAPTLEAVDGPPVGGVLIQGTEKQHWVYRLDVSGTRSDIERRLDDLVGWFLRRAPRRSGQAVPSSDVAGQVAASSA